MKRTISLLLVSAWLSLSASFADDIAIPAAPPALTAMLPAGLARGTSVDAVLQGTNLAGPTAVRVSGPGITAELLPPSGKSPAAQQVAVKLTAAADAEPGLRELRLVTPSGTSNVVRFVVGSLPEITESEPNDTTAVAARLPDLPLVVNGAINRAEDRDCFRFSAKAGQQIVLELCGQRLRPLVGNQRPPWFEGLLLVREATQIGAAADELVTAEKSAAEKAAAAKSATGAIASRQTAVQKATAEKSAADAALQSKVAAATTASTDLSGAQASDATTAEKVATLQAALDKANADKSTAEKTAGEKATALKKAEERLSAAQSAAKQAAEELAAATKLVSDRKAAVTRLVDQPRRDLAVGHDYGGREDPLLVFTVPRDGQYVVEVRDELYRGRAEYVYRLTIGELPLITAAFPAGGQRGTTGQFNLTGVNLDAANAISLPLAADARELRFLARTSNGRGPSNDVALEIGDDPEQLESEPNDNAAAATPAAVPSVLNGVIERDDDADHFKFTATKGQRLIFEIASRSLGSPLDARLELFDEKGRRLKESDDANGSPDSYLDHAFTADGEHVLRVSDTTGLGSRRHVYRLKVHPPRPDFSLTVSPDNPRVTAGGTVALKVLAQRREGFTGDIELSVSNPPPGAVVSPAVFTGNATEQFVSLTLPADAPAGILPLTIVGKSKLSDEQELVRPATPADSIRINNDWRYVPVNDVVLTILPAAPIALAWDAADTQLKAGETTHVRLKLQRASDFTAPVRVVLEGLPPRVVAPPVTIEENATEAEVEIRSTNNAPTNLSNVIANGSITHQGRTFVQVSPALRLQVTAVEKR